jgi:hypothetical protein
MGLIACGLVGTVNTGAENVGKGLPSVAATPAGQWMEIPDSALSAVAAKPSPGGAIAKITAWSGAALDADGCRLFVWGGGHSDYAGNEVYAFDLQVLKWERLSEPSVPDRSRAPLYPDGQPRARHTYNYLEFVPAIGKLVSFGGSGGYPTGGGEFTRELATFDPKQRQWVTGELSPVPSGGNMIGANARVDPRTGNVFFLASQRTGPMRYSPTEDRWAPAGSRTYVRVHATAAIDSQRGQLVLVGSGTRSPQVIRWPLDRPGNAVDMRGVTTGDKDIETAYGPGFDFHRPSGRFVAWAGGSDVYVLDPDGWKWTRQTPAPGNVASPGQQLATGTYGRFRYVPELDVFVLMNGADRNVFVYRLASL